MTTKRSIMAARLAVGACLLLAGCASAPSPDATAGRLSASTPGTSPHGTPSPPQVTAVVGAAPLFPAPTPLDGALPAGKEAGALLEAARQALRQADSFRFWMAHRGEGPAAADLEPDLPLIMAGVSLVGEQPRARWSISNLAGFPGRTIEYAFVDGDAWCDSGVSIWTVYPPGRQADVVRQDAEAMAPDGIFAWNFLDESVVLEVAGRDRLGAETAIRYEAVRPAEVPVPPWWGEMEGRTERFTIWVSDRGVPLQVEMGGTVRDGGASGAFGVTIQVTAIDDERNRVEAPA
jgi:hypothetical protein